MSTVVHDATVRCTIVDNQVRCSIVENVVRVQPLVAVPGGGGGDDPTKLPLAGGTLTGLLVLEGAAYDTWIAQALAPGDVGKRLWVTTNGWLGWDPTGTRSGPSAQLIPYSGTLAGLRQFWLTLLMDDAAYANAYDFNVFAVQHGKPGGGQPVIVMQAHDGTLASPTPTLANQSLGELAFRGCGTAGNYYPGLGLPGGIVGWSGATVQGHAVENWGSGVAGGALTLQTVKRGTAGRQASVVVFDGGQLVLDPATNPALTADWSLPSSRLRVVSQSATERTIVAKAAAGQSVPVLEVQDSNGVAVVTVSAAGAVALGAGSTMGGQALVTTNDSRLSDARTPLAHTHPASDITGLKGTVGCVIDGGGAVITTGLKAWVEVPYAGTITGWTILADQAGSIVVDVWKDTYANFPPTVADSIAGSEKPTLASAVSNTDTNLTTWTTSVAAGDVIAFNVDSAATVTKVSIALHITRS